MIIVEGPDGAGKTSLVNTLSESLNLKIHHSGGPPKDHHEILIRQEKLNAALYRREPMIYDRAPFISDSVYGPIVRGHTPFSEFAHLGRTMRTNLVVPVIYCRPPAHTIKAYALSRGFDESKSSYKPREHHNSVVSNLDQIIERYDALIGYFPHWSYDWTGGFYGMKLSQLLALIRQNMKTPEFYL